MNRNIAEKEYEIHYYEVDYKKRTFITSLMGYFNDVAIFQSEKLGIGIDYMIENNMAWILYKWDIDVKRYPKYGEKIIVTTEPCAFKKFYGYRKFQVLDSNREVIATANSAWLLINIKERKPIRVMENIVRTYGLTNDDNRILKIENIKELEKVDNSVEFRIRYSDIDTNGHVNNEKYAAWLIESVPLEIVLSYTLTNIKLTYKKESKYGEAVKVLSDIAYEDDKIIVIHRVVRDDEEITLGETTWEKNID
jgi:acyl-ACP thioesterase